MVVVVNKSSQVLHLDDKVILHRLSVGFVDVAAPLLFHRLLQHPLERMTRVLQAVGHHLRAVVQE